MTMTALTEDHLDKRVVASGPYPHELADLVKRMRAYPGWKFHLEHGTYDDGQVTQLRLVITVHHHNSYHPTICDRCSGPVPSRLTQFHYPVPVVTFDRASWQRWLRDRVADVHVHEDGEAIAFEYSVERRTCAHIGGCQCSVETVRFLHRPFAPFHGPGRDPNRQVEVGVDPMEQRILQDGSQAKGDWLGDGGIHDDERHTMDRGPFGDHATCTPIQVIK